MGALAHRSHASTPFDKVSPYSSHLLCRAVIPKTSKNYREISEKRRPVYAYNSFRISCNQSYLVRDPSASLQLTNSGGPIAFYKRSVGKYYKMYPYRRSDMTSTAAHETAKSSGSDYATFGIFSD